MNLPADFRKKLAYLAVEERLDKTEAGSVPTSRQMCFRSVRACQKHTSEINLSK